MPVTISINIKGPDIGAAVKKNLDDFIQKVYRAVDAAMNMARGMIDERAKAMIAGSGSFGGRWLDGLHVALDNMRISMSHDVPYADVFETGGTITGHPLLWLPLSGASRGGPMVAAAHSKIPLMLSINDKTPQLFGVASVTIPKKWDLNGVVQSVMANFADYFSTAMQG